MKKEIIAALSLSLAGCAAQAKNLTRDLERHEPEVKAPDPDANEALIDFTLSLLKQENLKENVMLSGYSAAEALAMCINGASGKTLSQMETVLGTDADTLNRYLYYVDQTCHKGDKNSLYSANSVWYRKDDRLHMNESFLQMNKDYYDADLFEATFDNSLKEDVNHWVEEKTDGQIQELLKNPPDDTTIMYLINALTFTGEWEIPYNPDTVIDGTFVTASGEEEKAEYMARTEYSYLKLEHGEGFVKPYKYGEYYFAAILPEEGMTMEDFVKSLDGEKLSEVLKNPERAEVLTHLPKFTFEYEADLQESLKKLGMTDAFDDVLADFTPMATYDGENIFVSKVIQKTKIQVDEQGTKAAAATEVAVEMAGAMPMIRKELWFDRPFLFIIADGNTHTPLFTGVVNHTK